MIHAIAILLLLSAPALADCPPWNADPACPCTWQSMRQDCPETQMRNQMNKRIQDRMKQWQDSGAARQKPPAPIGTPPQEKPDP